MNMKEIPAFAGMTTCCEPLAGVISIPIPIATPTPIFSDFLVPVCGLSERRKPDRWEQVPSVSRPLKTGFIAVGVGIGIGIVF